MLDGGIGSWTPTVGTEHPALGKKAASAEVIVRNVKSTPFPLPASQPAEIRTKRVRKQKTDRQDAQLILRLSPALSRPLPSRNSLPPPPLASPPEPKFTS
jgi:hypothetical protein